MVPKKKNILIIEDDPAMRVFMKATLRKSFFPIGNIFEAVNGLEGLKMLAENDVDYILTDINMPIMSGIEFIEQIHNHQLFKHLPIIAITTEKGKKLTNMLSYWGHGYIEKPFTLEILEEELSKFYEENYEHFYLYK